MKTFGTTSLILFVAFSTMINASIIEDLLTNKLLGAPAGTYEG